MERVFDASDESLHDVLAFVEEELDKHDCDIKTTMMITVVVEELFVNIAHYAYEGKEGSAAVSVEFLNNDVVIRFTDTGIPFDPTAKEDPDINASVEDRQIGGLGIYMSKKTMDDFRYKREGDKNILTIRKAIH